MKFRKKPVVIEAFQLGVDDMPTLVRVYGEDFVTNQLFSSKPEEIQINYHDLKQMIIWKSAIDWPACDANGNPIQYRVEVKE